MSIITASSFFSRRLTSRTRVTICRTHAWSAWAMFSRTTLAPALMIASNCASDSVAGPMVKVTRVWRKGFTAFMTRSDAGPCKGKDGVPLLATNQALNLSQLSDDA